MEDSLFGVLCGLQTHLDRLGHLERAKASAFPDWFFVFLLLCLAGGAGAGDCPLELMSARPTLYHRAVSPVLLRQFAKLG